MVLCKSKCIEIRENCICMINQSMREMTFGRAAQDDFISNRNTRIIILIILEIKN